MEAKKSFGQHFLHDQKIIAQIIAAAEPEKFKTVAEIGPGRGALTTTIDARLKEQEAKSRLLLLEADRDLIVGLQNKYPEAEIIVGDAAKANWDLVSGDWCLIGNLPYNAANAILMHALQAENPPSRAVIMVQKEVGERMLGLPGHMSVLGVAVGLYANVDKVCTVKPGAFAPPPLVDSMVLRLTLCHDRHPQTEQVIALAKAAFANRRKLLTKNLANAGMGDPERIAEWLVAHGHTAKARAEELAVAEWVDLYTFCQEVL